MSKKEKTLELGKVMKPNGKPFFSFDTSIKKITIEREYTGKDGVVNETLEVVENGDYLSGAFINKFTDSINFKRDQGWIDDKKAEADLAYGEDKGISSVFQVKVVPQD